MFVENIGGYDKVLISWKHLRNAEGLIYNLPYHGKTVCSLETLDRSVINTGKAHVMIPDNLCKNKGRKISLHNAMKRAGFSLEDRKKVWVAYYQMRGNKW